MILDSLFTETRAPTQSEVAEVTRRVQVRVLRQLKRRGTVRDPNDARNEAKNEPMIGCAQVSLRLGKLTLLSAAPIPEVEVAVGACREAAGEVRAGVGGVDHRHVGVVGRCEPDDRIEGLAARARRGVVPRP